MKPGDFISILATDLQLLSLHPLWDSRLRHGRVLEQQAAAARLASMARTKERHLDGPMDGDDGDWWEDDGRFIMIHHDSS